MPVFLYDCMVCMCECVQHVTRTMWGSAGQLLVNETGLIVSPFDFNQYEVLKTHPPFRALMESDGFITVPIERNCSSLGPYCGFPFYYPVASMIRSAPLTSPASSYELS